jgi:hypothetical protein
MPVIVEYETAPVLRINSNGLRRQNGSPVLRRRRQADLAPAAMDTTALFSNVSRGREGMNMEG